MKSSWILVVLCVPMMVLGQRKSPKINWKTPASLAVASALLYNASSKDAQTKIYQNSFSSFSTKADDYLQYGPTLLNIGAHLAGVEGNNSTRGNRLGIFVLGTGMYAVAVKGLKLAINEYRPNGMEQGFPSGHTATAFFGAQLLAKEYGEDYPIIAIAGYTLAGSTAFLRMANNEHWATDVLMGAAIGMGSAELASWLYPKIKPAFFKNSAWRFTPRVGNNYYAANLNYSF
jgi:membrane-associated phospholipid phosphatase